MVGNIYKRGLNRIKVIKDYSFEHVTVKEWGKNIKTFTHVISKKELETLDKIV